MIPPRIGIHEDLQNLLRRDCVVANYTQTIEEFSELIEEKFPKGEEFESVEVRYYSKGYSSEVEKKTSQKSSK